MSGGGETDIESLIDAARTSGVSDPDQEIATLQDLLRIAWDLMSEAQQTALLESDEAQSVLASDRDESDESTED
jgi:hypothetical protein